MRVTLYFYITFNATQIKCLYTYIINCIYINRMQFMKNISRSLIGLKSQTNEPQTNKQAGYDRKKIFNNQNNQQLPQIDDVQTFIKQITLSVFELSKPKAKTIFGKNKIYSEISIEPLYLLEDRSRILKFQFQLGYHNFLERIQILFKQVQLIQKAFEQIIYKSEVNLTEFFGIFEYHQNHVENIIDKVHTCRAKLSPFLLFKRKSTIKESYLKKQILLKKLRLLKAIKQAQSNVRCQNIDQIFYTQKERHNKYKKILKSQSLMNRVKFMAKFKQNLLSNTKSNLQIVKQSINQWLNAQLTDKQIEKLLIMIYYIKTHELYCSNDLKISLNFNNMVISQKFEQQIKRIQKWEKYFYISDKQTSNRVKQFLNSLTVQMDH